MKNFIAPDAKLIMHLPLDWEFINARTWAESKSPYQFCSYDDPVWVLTISCTPVSEAIDQKHFGKVLENQVANKTDIVFLEKKLLEWKHEFILWIAKVENHIFTISYNYENQKKNKEVISKELDSIEEILKSIMFIWLENRDYFIASERYKKFLVSLATAKDLENRAGESGSFIELVAILANQVDALLRIAIMLTNQINNKNNEIDISLIYQSWDWEQISERWIYKKSHKLWILDWNLCDRLQKLYDERNKVIHRYIITDLRTEDVLRIAIKYHEIRNLIEQKISEIELLQYQEKVWIYWNNQHPHEPLKEDEKSWVISLMKDKHWNIKNF